MDGIPCAAPTVPRLQFSTEGFAPRERLEAYRAFASRAFAIDPADGVPPPDFRARRVTWRIGSLVLSRTSVDALRSARDARHIRQDGLDLWVVTAWRGGRGAWRSGDDTAEAAPGRVLLQGLHHAVEGTQGPADWVRLYLPREALSPVADRLRAGVVGGVAAELLWTHLDALAGVADRLPAEEAPRVAEGTVALLRAALAGRAEDRDAARRPLEEALRLRAIRMIRAEIHSVRLDPARLARLCGVSRTRLYGAFEAEGGVAQAILRERLLAARRALADPAETRPVARVAEACGLADPSSFSRSFRRAFGVPPRAFREAALGPAPPQAAPWNDGADGGFAALLRSLHPPAG